MRIHSSLFFTFIAITVFALDQFTKAWATHLAQARFFLWPSFISVTQHQNYGLLADLPIPSWILLPINLFIIVLLISLFLQKRRDASISELCSFGLILGGALGNAWDRLHLGYVFDWILIANYSILNLADLAIGAGILWYVVQQMRPTSSTLDDSPKLP